MSLANDSPSPAAVATAERVSRWCLALAGSVTVAWFFIYASGRQDGLCDEPGHLGVIYHLQAGKPGFPEDMPMLPGYHFLVLGLSFGHPSLASARLVTTVTALLAILVFAAAWRRFHGEPPGPATLLFALLPVMQPYTAMAYTDVPALALVLGMWWAQLAGHRLGAALLLAAACLVRQTSIVWGAFLVAREAAPALWPGPARLAWRDAAGRVWRNGRWLLGVMLAGVAGALATGRITVGHQHGNQLAPNIATLHLAGVLLTVLGAPLALRHARVATEWIREAAARHPGRIALLAAAAAGTTALLALTFANPHAWNRELFWPGCTFTLLRNWPLVAIDAHPWLRWVSGANLVGLAFGLALGLWFQPHRRELWLSLLLGSLPAALNGLVEPRYFIPPLAFLVFFWRFDRGSFHWLAAWFALLCLLHAPFVAAGLSLW